MISTNTAEDKTSFSLSSVQLGTHMSGETFRTSVAIKLGADVCQPRRCPCGEAVSAKGLHGLACKLSRERISRHDAPNNDMLQALRTVDVPCIRELFGCSRSDCKRPNGQTLV
ncbi:hypothetical protein ILUMI_06300 [Ignelater luminosus]|uniref:Uncharacterized protein n=1 Tax=Ignelater luminosus TaxID=2038154 RepID=A0A8K0DAK3_IGNLU|nr:hypothetical protein ILUMI_06300 [Ignelater luminosus]